VAHLSERLAASTEMLTLARKVDDRELQLQAHAWLVVDLLENGQPDAVDAQIDAFTLGADQLRQPLYLWQAGVWRAMRAHLAGALSQAEELAADALAAGAPGESVTAPQYYAIQLLSIRREQARMGELEPAARQMVQANPLRPAWRTALATLLAETGRPEDAREEFRRVAAESFRDIPDDGDWMTTVALLADLAAELEEAQRAQELYDLLLPYAGLNVVIGVAAVCLGPVDRLLGRLATVTGRHQEAERWFEAALAAAERLRSPVWLGHARVDFARGLGGRGVRVRRMLDDAREDAAALGLVKVAARADQVG
jgi:tetratricopeptide (TPR) repeat protein